VSGGSCVPAITCSSCGGGASRGGQEVEGENWTLAPASLKGTGQGPGIATLAKPGTPENPTPYVP